MKDDLKNTADTLSECADHFIGKYKIPSFLFIPIRYSADFLDNKAENLWLTSDKDIRSSISQLEKKMNQ